MRLYWAALTAVVYVGSSSSSSREDDFSVGVGVASVVDAASVDAAPHHHGAPQHGGGLEVARALLSANKRRRALEVLLHEQETTYAMLMLRGELRSDVFGDLHNAAADFKRALQLRPLSADAWRRLGMAQLDSGKVEAAAESLGESLRLDPTDLGARHALERCRFSQRSTDVEIVTFATDESECGYLRLLASAEYHGHTIVNLAPTDLAPTDQAWFNGLKLKLLLAHAGSLPADTLVCAVDGYDVVLAGSSAQLARRFRQLASNGTVNVAHFTWPLTSRATHLTWRPPTSRGGRPLRGQCLEVAASVSRSRPSRGRGRLVLI
jgi:tetratricopeptide (TPR) repeat protein